MATLGGALEVAIGESAPGVPPHTAFVIPGPAPCRNPGPRLPSNALFRFRKLAWVPAFAG